MGIDAELEKTIAEFNERAVKPRLRDIGEEAVRRAVEEGDYHDVTGNLRRSNYYEITEDGLKIGNRAEYASDVEARGHNVITSAILYVRGELGR